MKKGSINPHLYRARIGICLVCGKEFRAVNDFGTRKQKYCDKICWSNRSPKIKTICKCCGKEFLQSKSRNYIYCSTDCRNEDYKKRFNGDKSHLWKGGKTGRNKILRTSSDFREWRQKVFNRDNYRCKLCEEKTNLHPHHIIKISENISEIFNINNGITVCATCHSIVHNKKIGKINMFKWLDKIYCDTIKNKYKDITGELGV